MEYLIHDNGARPYKVVITGQRVTLHKFIKNDRYHDEADYEYTGPVKNWTVKKVFVGKTIYDLGGSNKEVEGSSVLLQLSKFNYVFIGDKIFSFSSQDEIVQFYARVGPNDVTYPYAIDKRGNCYLLIENRLLENYESSKRDPYWIYYMFTGHIPQIFSFANYQEIKV